MRKIRYQTLLTKLRENDILQIKEYTKKGMLFKSGIITYNNYFVDFGDTRILYEDLDKRGIKYNNIK